MRGAAEGAGLLLYPAAGHALERLGALDAFRARSVELAGIATYDQRGRVHGLEALRVADCSIMPDCVRANTNATAMMIGERLAELIRA